MTMLLLQPSLKLFLLPSPPQLIQAKRKAREVIQVPSATNKGAVSFPLRALALPHRVYFLNEGPAFTTNWSTSTLLMALHLLFLSWIYVISWVQMAAFRQQLKIQISLLAKAGLHLANCNKWKEHIVKGRASLAPTAEAPPTAWAQWRTPKHLNNGLPKRQQRQTLLEAAGEQHHCLFLSTRWTMEFYFRRVYLPISPNILKGNLMNIIRQKAIRQG